MPLHKILFVFEPYNWSYCGGAIGVIADSFERAIDLISAEAREQAEVRAKRQIYRLEEDNITMEELIESCMEYRRGHFARGKEDLEGDSWVLTNEFDVPAETTARIAFSNYHEG